MEGQGTVIIGEGNKFPLVVGKRRRPRTGTRKGRGEVKTRTEGKPQGEHPLCTLGGQGGSMREGEGGIKKRRPLLGKLGNLVQVKNSWKRKLVPASLSGVGFQEGY